MWPWPSEASNGEVFDELLKLSRAEGIVSGNISKWLHPPKKFSGGGAAAQRLHRDFAQRFANVEQVRCPVAWLCFFAV